MVVDQVLRDVTLLRNTRAIGQILREVGNYRMSTHIVEAALG